MLLLLLAACWIRTDPDGDGFSSEVDCHREDPSVGPARRFFVDNDGDGFYGSEALVQCIEPTIAFVEDTVAADQIDCDDADSSTLGAVQTQWFPDADADGLGATEPSATGCAGPPGWVRVSGDCDDTDPGVQEIEGRYADADQDGFGESLASCGTAEVGGDCDDANPAIHPDALEVCNGLDDDCEGTVDAVPEGGDTSGLEAFRLDLDADGFGGALVAGCQSMPGVVAASAPLDDCDEDPGRHRLSTQVGVDAPTIAVALEETCPGGTVLAGGEHRGNFGITDGVTLIGDGTLRLVDGGAGYTVRIDDGTLRRAVVEADPAIDGGGIRVPVGGNAVLEFVDVTGFSGAQVGECVAVEGQLVGEQIRLDDCHSTLAGPALWVGEPGTASVRDLEVTRSLAPHGVVRVEGVLDLDGFTSADNTSADYGAVLAVEGTGVATVRGLLALRNQSGAAPISARGAQLTLDASVLMDNSGAIDVSGIRVRNGTFSATGLTVLQDGGPVILRVDPNAQTIALEEVQLTGTNAGILAADLDAPTPWRNVQLQGFQNEALVMDGDLECVDCLLEGQTAVRVDAGTARFSSSTLIGGQSLGGGATLSTAFTLLTGDECDTQSQPCALPTDPTSFQFVPERDLIRYHPRLTNADRDYRPTAAWGAGFAQPALSFYDPFTCTPAMWTGCSGGGPIPQGFADTFAGPPRDGVSFDDGDRDVDGLGLCCEWAHHALPTSNDTDYDGVWDALDPEPLDPSQ